MTGITSRNDALDVLQRNFDVFDGAKAADANRHDAREQAAGAADGTISRSDLEVVAASDAFTAEERAAAEYLLGDAELMDAIDGEDNGTINDFDRSDVLHFIESNRADLPYSLVASVDAQRIASGESWQEKLATYADLSASLSPQDRQSLLQAVLQESPEARSTWLHRDGLATLGPDGSGTISREAVDAAWDSLAPPVPAGATGMEGAGQLFDASLAGLVATPVEAWTSHEAVVFTTELARLVEDNRADPELVETLLVLSDLQLRRSAELLGNATENKHGEREDVEALTHAVSRIGNAVPEESAARLAYVVASEIPEDSEQNWVDDGFGAYVDEAGGNPYFRNLLGAALYDQGKNDAGDEMLYQGAGGVWGRGGLVDDAAGVVRGTFDTLKSLPAEAWHFVSEQVIDRAGDWLRDRMSDALGVEQRIGMLAEPGDMIFVGADVSGSLFGGQLELGAGAMITRTEDGYELELFGEGSFGIASELDLPGLPAEFEISSESGVGATLKFEFTGDDAMAEVVQASEVLMGLAAGIASPPPLSAVLIGSTIDEFGVFTENYQGLEIKFSQGVEADFDAGAMAELFNLPDVAGGVVAQSRVSLQIPADGVPQLVLARDITLDASVDVPSRYELGELSGAVSLQVRTSVPINVDFATLFDDPGQIGSVLLGATRDAASGAVTTVQGVVNLEIGEEGGLPGVSIASAAGGVQLEFEVSGGVADVLGAIGEAASGDLIGALQRIGDGEVDFTLRRYAEVGLGIGEVTARVDGTFSDEADGVGFNIPGVGGIEVTAGYAQRTSEIMWEGSGTELVGEFYGVLEDMAIVAG